MNIPESYIRYSYVVEGDFVAYANKFVSAIMEGLERPAEPPEPATGPAAPVSPNLAVDAVQEKMYNN